MFRRIFNWRNGVLASFAMFSAGILMGMYYWSMQSEQWRNYQYGQMAYRTTLYETAVEYFDISYANYQQMLTQKQDSYTVPPSLEMAELSQHFKALALVKQGTQTSVPLGVLTFKEALKLTTDIALAEANPKLSQAELDKIARDRSFTQQDLQILFHNKPQQAQAEGKGRGNGKKAGDKKEETPANGNQAGKQDREAL